MNYYRTIYSLYILLLEIPQLLLYYEVCGCSAYYKLKLYFEKVKHLGRKQ